MVFALFLFFSKTSLKYRDNLFDLQMWIFFLQFQILIRWQGQNISAATYKNQKVYHKNQTTFYKNQKV